MYTKITTAILSASIIIGCGGSVNTTGSFQSITKPQLAARFVTSPVAAKVGNILHLEITFTPGFADGVAQPLSNISLSTNAPADVFEVPLISVNSFEENVTTTTISLMSSLFVDRSYTVTVSGTDTIDRVIEPATATIDLSAVSGVASFTRLAANPAPTHSIYLTTASTPTNPTLDLRLMFQGNGDADSCVKTVSFHLKYDDVLGNGSTIDFVSAAKGSFVDCVDVACFMFDDDPDLKELTVFISPAGFSCKSAPGAVELMTLRFNVSTGVPIPLTFTNVDDTAQNGLRNGATSGSNYVASQQWLGGSALIVTP